MLFERFVENLFAFKFSKNGYGDNWEHFDNFDYDYSVEQENINENILRFFWNISLHILFSEEFESLSSNVVVAKFFISKKMYSKISNGMHLT